MSYSDDSVPDCYTFHPVSLPPSSLLLQSSFGPELWQTFGSLWSKPGFYFCLALYSFTVTMNQAYMSSSPSSLYELLVSAKVLSGSAERTHHLTLQNERVAKGFSRKSWKTPTCLDTRFILGPEDCRNRCSVFRIADIDVRNRNRH